MNTPILDKRIREVTKYLKTLKIHGEKFALNFDILKRLNLWRNELKADGFVDGVKEYIDKIDKGVRKLNDMVVDPGIDPGEVCGRDGCEGIIEEFEKDGSCSCHQGHGPCGYCTQGNTQCPTCEWVMEDA